MERTSRTNFQPLGSFVVAVALGWAGAVIGQTVQFRPGELLRANGAVLNVGSYAIPCVVDWNGDGRKDLLVGYQTEGKIALFLNSRSDADPEFNGSINLQAAGSDIQHPSSGCGAPAPFVCDYDADGVQDLLVGAGADGRVFFYRNSNSSTAPILAAGVQLMAAGSVLSVGSRATPCVYDWDGDGLDDLLCGSGDGSVYLFRNIGTRQAPAYAAAVLVQADGVNLNLGYRSVVRFWDLDGDGIKDLVGSSTDGVYWCRNTAREGAPALLGRVALRSPVSTGGLTPINTGPRMRLDLVDWNNHGTVDLLLGGWDGTITYYEGYRFEITSASAGAAGSCVLEWNSAQYLTYQLLAGNSLKSLTNVLMSNWPSAGNTTRWTNVPPASPQFYRVQIAE